MNCRNCGAASWSKGKCDYCSTSTQDSDIEPIAVAYFQGFIDDTQRTELMNTLLNLKSGEAVAIPYGSHVKLIPPPTKSPINRDPFVGV